MGKTASSTRWQDRKIPPALSAAVIAAVLLLAVFLGFRAVSPPKIEIGPGGPGPATPAEIRQLERLRQEAKEQGLLYDAPPASPAPRRGRAASPPRAN